MDIKNVYDLIDRFECSDLTELEVELQGSKMHLKRDPGNFGGGCGSRGYEPANQGGLAGWSEKKQGGPGVSEAAGVVSDKREAKNDKASAPVLTEIKAPLVGTFYVAASPDSEPFVKPGQEVKKGDVMGIIEAMKLMNEVTSTADGIVEEICPENGELVEYGQVLVTLR